MTSRRASCCVAVLLVAAGIFGTPATAASVIYSAVNTGVPNPNTYTYTYLVEGRSFAPNEGFEIFFDPALFEVTTSPVFSVLSAPTDWSAFALFAFPPLFPEGSLSAVWLGAAPTPLFSGPFVVQVDYLGASVPGAQRFEIVDFNSSGPPVSTSGWELLEAGVTQTPEPATVSLTLVGLGILGLWSRIRVRRNASNEQENH